MVRGPVLVAIASALIASAAASSTAGAQADPSSIDLVVDAGRPLRVELDRRIRLQSVGQPERDHRKSHQIPPTQFRSTTSRNIDLRRRIPGK